MTSTKTIAVILSLVLLGYLSTLGQTMASPSSVATIINEVTEVSTKTDPTATETKTIVVNPTASGSAHSSMSSNPLHATAHLTSITPTSIANKPSFGVPAFDMPHLGFVPSFVFASLVAVGFVMALV